VRSILFVLGVERCMSTVHCSDSGNECEVEGSPCINAYLYNYYYCVLRVTYKTYLRKFWPILRSRISRESESSKMTWETVNTSLQ
jgi:hypothetical protein